MAEKLVFRIEAVNKKFRDAVNDSIKKTENLQANLEGVAVKAGVAFAGLSAAIGGAVNEAIKIEQINTQFEVLTGSVLGAEKAVKQLQDLSATTPFSFESVAAAGKQLLGFGFSVDELTPRLQELGNVAAASGAPIQDLSLIFGQVRAAGKLTGERLLQLQERAIPIGPAIAQTLGVTEQAVKDLVSQGKVDFATFQEAFASLSAEGGFAFGGLDKQSQTLGGQISTLKDNFSLLAVEFGNQFLPILKQVTQAVTEFLQKIRNNPEFAETAANIAKITFVVTGLITGAATLGLGILKLKVAFAALVPIVSGAGTVLAAIAAPFLSIPGLIAAIVAAIVGLASAWDSNLSFVENFTVNFFGRITTLFSGLAQVITSAFKLDLEGIKSGFETTKAAFASNVQEMESIKDGVQERDAARREAELQANQQKLAVLEQQEIAANELKLAREQEQREQQLAIEQQRAEEDRAIQAEINELKLAADRQLTGEEEKILFESIKEKRKKKDEESKKDLLRDLEEKKELKKQEEKFGKEVVQLKKLFNVEEVQSKERTLGDLAQLQNSSNSKQKALGKAAAATQIGIDTARGAIAAYSSLAGIPIVGPALGAIAAAALISYGAERTRDVLSAQTGGIVPGFGSGDIIPAMLEPGELVVPRQNFEEVVNSVANQREGGGGLMEVMIGFTDNAFEIIEEKILERRATGVGII